MLLSIVILNRVDIDTNSLALTWPSSEYETCKNNDSYPIITSFNTYRRINMKIFFIQFDIKDHLVTFVLFLNFV